MDAMGHGFSEGPGARTQWTHLSVVQEDLRQLILTEKKPVVLVAESMGATIGIPIAADVDGLVLASGLLKMAKATSPPRFIVGIMVALGMAFPALKVTLPTLNATFDSAFGDPQWAARARRDPNIVVTSFFLGSVSQVLRETGKIRRHNDITCPLLMMQSTVDTRTDFEAATAFFDAVVSDDKKLILYDDASHLLFLDAPANVRRATTDLLTWLDDHFSPPEAETEETATETTNNDAESPQGNEEQ